MQESNTSLNQGQWHHLVRTWDGNSMSLYIDGNLDFKIETTGNSLVEGSHNIHLGGDPSNPYASQNIFFDGSLDEFRFYDRSLSDLEIIVFCIDLIPIVENFALDIGKAPDIILNYYSLFH